MIDCLPLDLLCRLSDKEAHSVGGNLAAPGVDGDLGVATLVGLHLDGQQEELQLYEAEPKGSSSKRMRRVRRVEEGEEDEGQNGQLVKMSLLQHVHTLHRLRRQDSDYWNTWMNFGSKWYTIYIQCPYS